MKAALARVSVALVVVSLSGCGTVCNLAGGVLHPDKEPRVYGGVLRDMELIEECVNAPQAESPSECPRTELTFLVLGAADPILSFVGDTLTLPITIPLQNRRSAVTKNKEAQGVPPADVTPRADSPSAPVVLDLPVVVEPPRSAAGSEAKGEK
jgi:hypothetical protein